MVVIYDLVGGVLAYIRELIICCKWQAHLVVMESW